ncbi:MAG: HAD-IA family hydrolase [Terracidiphilus sp.]
MDRSVAPSPVQILCKGILFDMDGILISSIGSVERSWTKWANLRGVDAERTLHLIHGRRSIESVAELRPDLDAEKENQIIEQFEIDDTEGLMVLPGVLDLIASLPPERWTVVTSATDPLARVRLASAGIPVPKRLITAESVAHGKPHPAPYQAGAALLGFASEDCIAFEDAASGTKSARAAGCTVVATPFSHPIDALQAAHYLIPDLTGVNVELSDSAGSLAVTFTPL